MTKKQCSTALLTLVSILIACFQLAYSQTVGTNPPPTTASSTPTVNDEPYALFDGLVRELRNGGFVLYMRHGAVLTTSADKRGPGAWWQDCANTQRLVPESQPRARVIAEALVRQRIAVQEVVTSEFCRATDTAAQFGLAPARRSPALNDLSALPDNKAQTLANYAIGIQVLISSVVPPKTNRVLVGHSLPPAMIHPALSYLPEGHVAIFKAEGNSRFHYVTSVSPGQWQWIGKQAVPDQISNSSAQTPTSNPQVAPATTPPPPAVLIAPEKELKGAALVRSLRQGGYNLYMRHAQSTVGQDGNLQQTPMWWENCAIQRNMSDSGKEQARRVGSALRDLKIPIYQVITAQFCRTRETGHLLGLGPIEITEDINHQIGQRAGFDINVARFKRLAEVPPKGMNNVLVSHTHGSTRIEERIMSGIQEAEIVAYLPDGKGGSEPVARIPVTEWEVLVKTTAAAKS